MATLNTENLFLMEFLIDDIKLSGNCNCSPEDVCVSFQFLDNEPMDVCEGDFSTDSKFGENGTSKTGKSCLFSLTPAQIQQILSSFDVTVRAFKKKQRGCIGTARVSVLQLFLDLVNQQEASNTTPAKVMQETHNLIDTKGIPIGTVSVYIRLSCYGKMIVTQFQMNMDDKSVLFKGKDGQSMYRYRKTKKGKPTKIEDVPPTSKPTQAKQLSYDQINQVNPMFQPTMYGQYPQPNLNYPMAPCFTMNRPNNFAPQNFPMQNSFPQSNVNCPTQQCYPDFGQSMYEMGMMPGSGRPAQMPFNKKRPSRSACSGGCRRN